MSSEKKESDEKPFKKPADEGRADAEIAEIAEVSPSVGLSQKGDFRLGCDDRANTSLRLGTKSSRPFNTFCGPQAKTEKRRERIWYLSGARRRGGERRRRGRKSRRERSELP